MSALLGLELSQKFAVGGWWGVDGLWWWWSKSILEFCFGPNLGLRLEAGTKLNNISPTYHENVCPNFFFGKSAAQKYPPLLDLILKTF